MYQKPPKEGHLFTLGIFDGTYGVCISDIASGYSLNSQKLPLTKLVQG